jgi:hypothetical protein
MKKYRIKTPLFRIFIDGVEDIVNEYTFFNLKLMVAKKIIKPFSFEIKNGIQTIEEDGRLPTDIEPIDLNGRESMKLISHFIRQLWKLDME